jgi:hypothetical protein
VTVATDYFTKWTEAIPLNNMTHKELIGFITEHIIHRFHSTNFNYGSRYFICG